MALADCDVSLTSFRLPLQPVQPREMEKDRAGNRALGESRRWKWSR